MFKEVGFLLICTMGCLCVGDYYKSFQRLCPAGFNARLLAHESNVIATKPQIPKYLIYAWVVISSPIFFHILTFEHRKISRVIIESQIQGPTFWAQIYILEGIEGS